jgi:hypothetical protein
MQRIATTVIGLVGEPARACAQALDRAANIRVELPDPSAPPLDRAVAAWQAATSTQAPYLVHDADPWPWSPTPGSAATTSRVRPGNWSWPSATP